MKKPRKKSDAARGDVWLEPVTGRGKLGTDLIPSFGEMMISTPLSRFLARQGKKFPMKNQNNTSVARRATSIPVGANDHGPQNILGALALTLDAIEL